MCEKYIGQEHALFFRHLTNAVNSGISREEHFWKTVNNETSERKLRELKEVLAPAMIGSAVVTFIANVEHLIGKKADGRTWDMPDGWYGKEEFKIWRKIRHCWAHAAGKVLDNLKDELEEALRKLRTGDFVKRDGKVLQPFFSIENDKVIINGLERARLLCTELLAEKGLVEKWPNY